uniref:Uncharacterized protein n=1 Tax=Gossypium raimondii TaxID=29730 RepID=A0A0D2S6A1_GOSRA|nr:hypothetical protein B456_004G261000 [Gossypium raimondii]
MEFTSLMHKKQHETFLFFLLSKACIFRIPCPQPLYSMQLFRLILTLCSCKLLFCMVTMIYSWVKSGLGLILTKIVSCPCPARNMLENFIQAWPVLLRHHTVKCAKQVRLEQKCHVQKYLVNLVRT